MLDPDHHAEQDTGLFSATGAAAGPSAGGTDAHLKLVRLTETPAELSSEESLEGTFRSRPVDSEWLARVRGEFSERDWRFFWRLVVDGQTAVEVAAEFGVTPNAVRLVKMRVLRRLREELNVTPPNGTPTI